MTTSVGSLVSGCRSEAAPAQVGRRAGLVDLVDAEWNSRGSRLLRRERRVVMPTTHAPGRSVRRPPGVRRRASCRRGSSASGRMHALSPGRPAPCGATAPPKGAGRDAQPSARPRARRADPRGQAEETRPAERIPGDLLRLHEQPRRARGRRPRRPRAPRGDLVGRAAAPEPRGVRPRSRSHPEGSRPRAGPRGGARPAPTGRCRP